MLVPGTTSAGVTHAGVLVGVHAAVLYWGRGHTQASRTELGTTKTKRR